MGSNQSTEKTDNSFHTVELHGTTAGILFGALIATGSLALIIFCICKRYGLVPRIASPGTAPPTTPSAAAPAPLLPTYTARYFNHQDMVDFDRPAPPYGPALPFGPPPPPYYNNFCPAPPAPAAAPVTLQLGPRAVRDIATMLRPVRPAPPPPVQAPAPAAPVAVADARDDAADGGGLAPL